MKSCYVHIPFCSSICHYCSFYKRVFAHNSIDTWLQILIDQAEGECRKQKETDPSFSLSTLYFGGGTPNLLSSDQFEKLACVFAPYLDQDCEFTVECNPEHVSFEQILRMKHAGVSRISLGIQTFHDLLLQKIGRSHTANQARQALAAIRQAGIHNISVDLIYALPGQSLEDLKDDLDQFLSLNLPHISIYSLQIEEGSLMYSQNIQPADEELEADMYELIVKTLKENGYDHYEISSFAKPGFYSRHNLAYWQDEDWLALGAGAAGKSGLSRYRIAPDLKADGSWTARVIMENNEEEADFEALMMSLRTRFGLDIAKWNERYQKNFLQEYAESLKKYVPDFLILEDNILKPTHAGMGILNWILSDFLLEREGK